MLAGIMEGIQKFGDKPKMFYSDEEGSLYSKTVIEHPAFAERCIRTCKDMLFKRVEADASGKASRGSQARDEKKGKQNIQWIDYNLEILLTYNNKMASSTTKMTPLEARKKKSEFEVKLNISLQAKRNRTHPEIEVGNSVKIMRKKGISEKERTSHWVKTPQTVKRIDKKLGQN